MTDRGLVFACLYMEDSYTLSYNYYISTGLGLYQSYYYPQQSFSFRDVNCSGAGHIHSSPYFSTYYNCFSECYGGDGVTPLLFPL